MKISNPCPGSLIEALILWFCLTLFMGGCALIKEHGKFEPLILLSPASFGTRADLWQQITVKAHGQNMLMNVALEIDDRHISIVGLTMERRIMSVEYDGSDLKVWKSSYLPSYTHPENVLANIQLALWPGEAVQSALEPGWVLKDDGLIREIYFMDELRMRVRYSDSIRWHGTINIESFQYNYQITIQSGSI